MKKLILLISIALSVSACDFLDIVPDDTPVLNDAFKNEQTAEGFMYSCYAKIPDYTNFRTNFCWLTTPEVVFSYHWIPDWFVSIGVQQGKYSAANPMIDIWKESYRGIRQCYTFLANIDGVPGVNISPEDLAKRKAEWKAQCKFLIAYYHYILLQNYGPIVVVDKLIDFNSTGDDFYRPRKTYDESVEEVAKMFDEAIKELPVSVEIDDYGRPTKMAAQAIKARMYLYAASPLFNGNTKLYANFKNQDGTNLISQTYDKEKWKKALDEAELAITMAKDAGRELYQSKITGTLFDVAVNAERYVMTDPWNSELIWGYSGVKEGIDNGNSYQKHVIPRGMGATNAIGGIGTTLPMVKLFHTENGLPIDKDPAYDNSKIMTIEPGDSTIYLHRHREPRFYAWVGFDRGNYPCNGITNLKLRAGEKHGAAWAGGSANLGRDLIYGGYAIAKGIHPDAKMTATQRSIVSYPYILARLGEMYLNYSEAYVEYYGKLDGKALGYVNEIRTRAGIPNIEVSYAKIGGLPTGQNELIDIIRRERTIELLFEGHMHYDYRRWMTASHEFAGMTTGMVGLNAAGATAEDFYKETRLTTQPFVFTSKQYLHPIKQDDINVNRKLVQNPGWGADKLPEL